MRGRPKLFTSYEADAAIFPTQMQKWMVGIGILILFLMPFEIPLISGPVPRAFPETWPLIGDRYTVLGQIPVLKNGIPPLRFLGDAGWIRPMTEVFIFAIAALGLNLLAGVAGQVSLGHAFFMGMGAVTAAVLGGAECTWVLSRLAWCLSGCTSAVSSHSSTEIPSRVVSTQNSIFVCGRKRPH